MIYTLPFGVQVFSLHFKKQTKGLRPHCDQVESGANLFSIRKIKTFAFQMSRFISYRCRKWQSLVSRMVCECLANKGNHKGLPVQM